MKSVWLFLLLLALIALEPGTVGAIPPEKGSAALGDLWLDVSMGLPLTEWFNQMARPNDIARVDNSEQIPLLDQVTAGRKMVVFKSVAEAGARLPFIARGIDVVGYNLEQGPASPAEEQADPLGSIQSMQELAQRYNLLLALGPDREFALSHGVEMAPYVDIFVLQIQRVQTEPDTVREFVLPLAGQLRQANPELLITVQIRTEGNISDLVELLDSLKGELDGVSILTSAGTVNTAEALVREIRARSSSPNAPESTPESPTAPVEEQEATPLVSNEVARLWVLTLIVALGLGAIGGGLLSYLLFRGK